MAFSLGDRWEMFYTDSLNDEDLVDQICIDASSKRYILDIDEHYMITEGYDMDENPVFESTYVSRNIFNIIVEGIKTQKYVEYVSKSDDED